MWIQKTNIEIPVIFLTVPVNLIKTGGKDMIIVAFFRLDSNFFKSFFCTDPPGFLIAEKTSDIRSVHIASIFFIAEIIRTLMVKMGFANADIGFSVFGQMMGKPWNCAIVGGRVVPGSNSVYITPSDKAGSSWGTYRTGSITVIKNGTFCS